MSAQSTIGLPKYGVLLHGTPTALVIENQTGRRIVVTMLRFETLRGDQYVTRNVSISNALLSLRDKSPNERRSVPSHGSRAIASEPSEAHMGGTIDRVNLDGVVFEDGEFVGPDPANQYPILKAKFDLERQLYQMALREDLVSLQNIRDGITRPSDLPGVHEHLEGHATVLLGVNAAQGTSAMRAMAERGLATVPVLRRGGK